MTGRSVASSLAMGNAIVLKPAEDTSLTALALARLAEEAGFPPGVFNVVTGLGEEAGAALSADPGVGKESARIRREFFDRRAIERLNDRNRGRGQ
jgi:aldehyde dehydrogenase (NAD+)